MKAKLTLDDATEITVDITQEELERLRMPETGRWKPGYDDIGRDI